jgi:hypothetical protein
MLGLQADFGGHTVIELLVNEYTKIINVKYDNDTESFLVECLTPNSPEIMQFPFNKDYFPDHKPFLVLDESIQVGENVYIWLKEEELLKREGWKETKNNMLISADSPFKIGKSKKGFLGGAHKGFLGLDEKFRPFIKIGKYRFSANEIKCIVKTEDTFYGKNARITTPSGEWEYLAEQGIVVMSDGKKMSKVNVGHFIDLIREAKLI